MNSTVSGQSYSRSMGDGRKVLASCEIYDPSSDTWTLGTQMLAARCLFDAVAVWHYYVSCPATAVVIFPAKSDRIPSIFTRMSIRTTIAESFSWWIPTLWFKKLSRNHCSFNKQKRKEACVLEITKKRKSESLFSLALYSYILVGLREMLLMNAVGTNYPNLPKMFGRPSYICLRQLSPCTYQCYNKSFILVTNVWCTHWVKSNTDYNINVSISADV